MPQWCLLSRCPVLCTWLLKGFGEKMMLNDEVWSTNILHFHRSNMSQMCCTGLLGRFHPWHHHSGPDRHGHPSDEQATVSLCGSLQDFSVSPKTICNSGEIQYTRGVEIQLFQLSIQIAIVWLREMQQSKPRLFFFVFLKPLPSIFSETSFSSFFCFFFWKTFFLPLPQCADRSSYHSSQ